MHIELLVFAIQKTNTLSNNTLILINMFGEKKGYDLLYDDLNESIRKRIVSHTINQIKDTFSVSFI